MSLASHACLNDRTMLACRTAGDGVGLRGQHPAARGEGQLPAGAGRPAGDLGDVGEGKAEDVVQDERDPLGRRHRVQHDQERHADRLVQGDPVRRVRGAVDRAAAAPFGRLGHRFRHPLPHIAFPPGPSRAEQVETDPAGHLAQPRARHLDRRPPWLAHRVPAGVGLLDRVLGVGERAEQPVGEIDQLPPLADHRTERGVGSTGHVAPPSSVVVQLHRSDETAPPNVSRPAFLTIRGAGSSDR